MSFGNFRDFWMICPICYFSIWFFVIRFEDFSSLYVWLQFQLTHLAIQIDQPCVIYRLNTLDRMKSWLQFEKHTPYKSRSNIIKINITFVLYFHLTWFCFQYAWFFFLFDLEYIFFLFTSFNTRISWRHRPLTYTNPKVLFI